MRRGSDLYCPLQIALHDIFPQNTGPRSLVLCKSEITFISGSDRRGEIGEETAGGGDSGGALQRERGAAQDVGGGGGGGDVVGRGLDIRQGEHAPHLGEGAGEVGSVAVLN